MFRCTVVQISTFENRKIFLIFKRRYLDNGTLMTVVKYGAFQYTIRTSDNDSDTSYRTIIVKHVNGQRLKEGEVLHGLIQIIYFLVSYILKSFRESENRIKS